MSGASGPQPSRGPVVVKLGGTGVESPSQTPELWRAVRRLAEAERLAGRPGVILVHGGGKAADAHLAKLGHQTVRHEGLRVTPPELMRDLAGVLGGTINKSIVAALQGAGQRAVGLCPGEGGTATFRRVTPGGADIGLVGEITGGDPSLVCSLLEAGIVPVFSPIGVDAASREGAGLLNVNADDVAAGIAGVCGARLLILLTDVPGLLDAQRRLVHRATAGEIEVLIARGVISGGMVPKVRAALDAAVRRGVPTVIASWDDPAALLRIAEGHDVGTCIEAGEHSHHLVGSDS